MRKQTVDMPSLAGPQRFPGLAETAAAPLTVSVSTLKKGGRLSNEPKDANRVRLAPPFFGEMEQAARQLDNNLGGNKMEPYSTYAVIVWMFATIGVIASIITGISLVKEFVQWLKSVADLP